MASMPLGGYGHLFVAVLRRELLVFVRYPVDAMGAVVVHSIIFAILFVGGTAVAGGAFADSLDAVVVGYFLWMLATTAYMTIAEDIQAEARWGTLERHFVSPFGFANVLFAKSVAKLVLAFVYAALLLVVMLAVTGTRLHVDVLTIVPLAVATLLSVLGVGFAMAGVTVLYKSVSNWTGLLQFGFVGLVAAPALEWEWTVLLPLVQGSHLLQRAMRDGIRLWELPPSSLAILVVTAVGYLALGYLVFQRSQKRARRLGVLGDY
ncbi:ABC transporter permease [Natronobiforma cellulositropha]|uniref:ABC transporter permease n=1 Tax=Natronobiforma cellulositropha TaxID=1679076 RepID=UPI0021D5BE51|nr:ABC transporter permease [Natronobiforma cellulositropha]